MRKISGRKTGWLPALTIILPVAGCAPGPPPPVFPGLLGFGLGWLAVGVLIWIGILLWKRQGPPEPCRTDYLTEALNAVNERLVILEEKIEQLGKKQRRKKK